MHVYFVSSPRRMRLFTRSVLFLFVLAVLLLVASYYDDLDYREKQRRNFGALAEMFGLKSTDEIRFLHVNSTSSLDKALKDESVHFLIFDVTLDRSRSHPVIRGSDVKLENWIDEVLDQSRKIGIVIHCVDIPALESTFPIVKTKKFIPNLLWFSWIMSRGEDFDSVKAFIKECDFSLQPYSTIISIGWKSTENFENSLKKLLGSTTSLQQRVIIDLKASTAVQFKPQLIRMMQTQLDYSLLVRLDTDEFALTEHFPYRTFTIK